MSPTPDEGQGDEGQGIVAGSGDRAISVAAERARSTGARNAPAFGDLPVPDDTANLRLGPDLHPDLLALLPLVGVWRGTGEASHPGIEPYRFGQQVVVAHDGRAFLTWESRSWVLAEPGLDDTNSSDPNSSDTNSGDTNSGDLADAVLGPSLRESGFWRVQATDDGEDTLELLLTHAAGTVELYYGAAVGTSTWEIATDVVIRSSSGAESTGATRLYGIVDDGDLAWVEERAMGGAPLQPHLSAKLARVVG